jgi:phosphate:Na+ symporter
LGLLFFGMSVMSDAMQPLRSYQPFLDLMVSMETPAIGILIAAAFTALVQSSSATTAIVIVMAGEGFVSLPAGIALAFGANIGTCVTALLAAIGKPREAVRAAATHVLFNVAGVLLWFSFIDQLAAFVTSISPSHAAYSGAQRVAADTPREIANAHTIFNVANTLIFIWFTTPIARLIEWLIPDRPLDEEAVFRSRFLDEELLSTPSIALDRVRMEIERMGEHVEKMLVRIMPAILQGSKSTLNEIREMDESVDALHAQIVTYLGKISVLKLTQKQSDELLRLMDVVNDLENIGDVIETNLVELGISRIDKNVSISPQTREMLLTFHAVVARAVADVVKAVAENSADIAESVVGMKQEITTIANSAAVHESKRLVASEPNRIEAYTIEIGITEKLQRVYYFAKRIARKVIQQSAEAPL